LTNKERPAKIDLLRKERENKRRKTKLKVTTNIACLTERLRRYLIVWWNLQEFSVEEANILMQDVLNRESSQSSSV
jgi:hypothetical protein